MRDDTQSIEDLLENGESGGNLETKFKEKQAEIKLKEIEHLTQKEAAKTGFPYINLSGFPISPEALVLIKEEDACRLQTVCFYYDGRNVRLGSLNPADEEAVKILEDIKKKKFCSGEIYLISRTSLDFALRLYKMIPKVREVVRGVKIAEEDLNKFSARFSSFKELADGLKKAEVTDALNIILAAAIKMKASDVHIEGEEKEIKVRLRIDGVLHEAASLKIELWQKILSRLKLLTGAKINITDKPQDGHTTVFLSRERIDIRASFLPASYGENVVMRLLFSSSVGISFEELGIRPLDFKRLNQEMERPNGMIISTGPTGSGKTTTLYAILKKLNKPETKIITIEDPIEYQLPGINQSQASERYTFVKGLRSIVRQDPDVIMVGEIRDLETAEIAIQAALTGHLVLSTLHTNDAAGTVPRFISMGTKPFLLAPALNAIIGQRLVRKICRQCKREVKLEEEVWRRVKEILEQLPAEEKKELDMIWPEEKWKFFEGAGCENCQGIGYEGRIGIYEIMIMNEKIEKIILSGRASEYDMRRQAVADGMTTMVQDGLLKALAGITSVKEVFRVAE